jgi:hypothetical protein
MSLTSIIKGILNIQKKIDLKTLPSQGIFYNDGFEIYIKKANLEDIIEYEYDYDEEQLGSVISKIKKIVEKNTTITPPNTYNDVKSIDIVFLFLEIVKFTNNKPINIAFFNDLLAKEEHIKFESTNFNYFQLDEKILEKYDSETKEFNFEGFKYSVPSIGVENALTQFLISKSLTKNSEIDSPTKILFSTFSIRAVAPEVSAVTFLLVKIVLSRAVLYRTLTSALFAGAVLNIIFLDSFRTKNPVVCKTSFT